MSLLQELATEARRINAANGWGLDFNINDKHDIPCSIALIHSEITEAWTATSPQECVRELGDVIVRCLDLSELLDAGVLWQTEPKFLNGETDYLPDGRRFMWQHELVRLHALTSHALEVFRKVEDFKASLLDCLLDVIRHAWLLMLEVLPACSPEKVIREILEKNSQRAYRHGGRRT